jgi:hypothetical protein
MGFLRRLLGTTQHEAESHADPSQADAVEADAEERAYELDLLEAEDARLDDLAKRQLRYASYAWQPPAQGGERRADDHDADR